MVLPHEFACLKTIQWAPTTPSVRWMIKDSNSLYKKIAPEEQQLRKTIHSEQRYVSNVSP